MAADLQFPLAMQWVALLVMTTMACATAESAPGPDAGAASPGDEDVAPGADAGTAPPLLQPDADLVAGSPTVEVAYVSSYITDGFTHMSDVGSLVLVVPAGGPEFSGDVRVLEVTHDDPDAEVWFEIDTFGDVDVEPGTSAGQLNFLSATLLLGSGLVAEPHSQSQLTSRLELWGARPGNYEIHASAVLELGEHIVDLPLTFQVSTLPVPVPHAAATRLPVD